MKAAFPGTCASPKETAAWMARVAEEEFGLPGILPVMCSCVELTGAWTSQGCLEDVPGYASAVDYDSLGLFQQRPSQGWGTPGQLTDAEYALRKFCEEAAKLKDYEWHEDTMDADALGRWCQAVQRSAYPDAYQKKGYSMALELLEDGEEAVNEYPERRIYYSSGGYAHDGERWLRSEPNLSLRTDGEGWLGNPVSKSAWSWPEASAPVGHIGDGSYVDLHPTRYSWRGDVEEVARHLVDTYGVTCNTYVDHPPGYGRDSTSLDAWGPGGRGDPLDYAVGQAIFDDIFSNGKPPWIEWTIWQGWIWTAAGGWSWFSDDEPYSDNGHFRHIHWTFS